MIQEIIDGLTQEKLQYHLTEQMLEHSLQEAKMLLIESVFGFEKVRELQRKPMNMEEAKDWSEAKAKQEIESYYLRARQEIYGKRYKSQTNS